MKCKAIKIKHLCNSCIEIRPHDNTGELDEFSISEFLNSEEYRNSNYILINRIILLRLEKHGGCEKCIDVLKRSFK